ncbi:MAG: septal ring lytic transglycosylase RlpA family protein [Arenimonas sp.]|nr:septal ring lytic transglycosylase RlpA family protein [Arenimonas sp.]
MAAQDVPPACLQVREHRDEDYTPGGLYAPGVRDSAPEHALDISNIPEPEPRAEPASRYGNRSPYTVLGKRYQVLDQAEGYVERGLASWYGQKFHGRHTSSRELYDMCSFSAAHKTLPLPSYVRVTNLDNGRSAIVRVNDRGPFHPGRIIDLSYAAAVKLGVDRTGTARVEVAAITGGTPSRTALAPAAASRGPLPAAAPNLGPQIVQVGAYRDEGNARRIAQSLRAAGISGIEVEPVRLHDGKVWRVRIAPVSAPALESVLSSIRALGLPSPRVFSE